MFFNNEDAFISQDVSHLIEYCMWMGFFSLVCSFPLFTLASHRNDQMALEEDAEHFHFKIIWMMKNNFMK